LDVCLVLGLWSDLMMYTFEGLVQIHDG
jgi:hypothetical protein